MDERQCVSVLQDWGVLKGMPGPRAFIVHGHDEASLLQLKNYLQNKMGWPEPIVLHEQPNCGRTIIEKFEHYPEQIDCVFVQGVAWIGIDNGIEAAGEEIRTELRELGLPN
jgi:predicted nucleotide-binding protein